MNILKAYLLVAILLLFKGSTLLLATSPNVVLIVADDLGIEIGAYGDPQAETPRMDQMAEQGVLFETAWVTSASCSPSRSSIHTGMYPHQNGLIGLSHHGHSMHKSYPTIASILRDNGYRTGLVGKYHIQPWDAAPWDFLFANNEVVMAQRDVQTMAHMARGFAESNTDSPFFLMMSYVDPHVPFFDQRGGLPEELIDPSEVIIPGFLGFSTPALQEQVAGYYNCISRLDTGIGMLLDLLQEAGVLDNTLVILIGDHGAPFARAKLSVYDRGLRIPFIVHYPNAPARGKVVSDMVSTVDLLPTILDLTGLEVPAGLPGHSLMAYLQDSTPPPARTYLFGEHNAHQSFHWLPMRTIRTDRFQLIKNLLPDRERQGPDVDGNDFWTGEGEALIPVDILNAAYEVYLRPPAVELYDLKNDPYCFVNLADDPDFQEIKQKLLEKLANKRAATGDPFLCPDHLAATTEKYDFHNQ